MYLEIGLRASHSISRSDRTAVFGCKHSILTIITSKFWVTLQGDKNIIKFEGDHNSPRPQFYYDSVSIFFYNVLQPPQIPSSCTSNFQRYYDLGELKAGAGTDEVISCIFLF